VTRKTWAGPVDVRDTAYAPGRDDDDDELLLLLLLLLLVVVDEVEEAETVGA